DRLGDRRGPPCCRGGRPLADGRQRPPAPPRLRQRRPPVQLAPQGLDGAGAVGYTLPKRSLGGTMIYRLLGCWAVMTALTLALSPGASAAPEKERVLSSGERFEVKKALLPEGTTVVL